MCVRYAAAAAETVGTKDVCVGRRSVTDWRAVDSSVWPLARNGSRSVPVGVSGRRRRRQRLCPPPPTTPTHYPSRSADTVARARTTLKHTRRCHKESLRRISFLQQTLRRTPQKVPSVSVYVANVYERVCVRVSTWSRPLLRPLFYSVSTFRKFRFGSKCRGIF